jgi:hypothetical protein
MTQPVRDGRARIVRVALWVVLWVACIAWVAALWHPWIDWFGRPR